MNLEKLRAEIEERIARLLRRSLYVLRVDSGSCNGCEIEIFAALTPLYDVERFGVRLVASPRHADALLVTGPVTRQFLPVLKRVYEMVPEPKVVIAVGACGCGGGIWYNSYAVEGGVDKVIPVDVYIPGCPPHPAAILHGILVALGVLEQKVRKWSYSEPSTGGRRSPLAIVASRSRPFVMSWELYRDLDRVARKYLGYLYGSALLKDYVEMLLSLPSVSELERESRRLVNDRYGGDPQVARAVEEMNRVVERHLRARIEMLAKNP